MDRGQIRIAILSRDHLKNPYSGISIYSKNLERLLSSQGFDVTIFAEPNLVNANVGISNQSVLVVEPSHNIIQSILKFRTPHPVAAWLKNVEAFLPEYSIVFAPIVSLQSRIFISNRISSRIVTLHTPYSKLTPWNYLYRHLQESSINKADKIVANSRTIISKLKLDSSSNCFVIPHEASPTFENSVFPSEQRWLWIGTLNFRKGVDRLLYLLVKNRKGNIDVVYSRTRFSFPLELILKGLCRKNLCRLHTKIDEKNINKLYVNASGLISTSRFESFGLTLVEAGIRSRCVIGLEANGPMETLPANEGGIWVKSVKELLEIISNDAVENDSWEVLGKKAYEFTSSNYNAKNVAGEIRRLLNS